MDSQMIIDGMRDYLDAQGWNYDYDAEKQLIRTGINIKNHVKSLKIFITVNGSVLSTYFIPAVNGDTEEYTELLKFLNFANWNMTSGSFELDPSDGEIRFRYSVRLNDFEAFPESCADAAIVIPAMMYQKYGDSIATLCFGYSSAEEEIQKIHEAEEADE